MCDWGFTFSDYSYYKKFTVILRLHQVMKNISLVPCKQYYKVPKFWDARNLCCNLPKIQTKRKNIRVFCQIEANGKANNEDPDQTAPRGAV